MNLVEAQDMALQQVARPPGTTHEALIKLAGLAVEAKRAFDRDQLLLSQQIVEDVLLHALLAAKSFDLNPEKAFQRALARHSEAGDGDRSLRIYPDRVEVVTQGRVRGEWPIYTEEDHEAAIRLARELGCQVVYPEGEQLELFS